MGERVCVSDGTTFPLLMVIDATVYFSDVFICRSPLTGASQRRALGEIKQRGFFSASVLSSRALRRHRSGSRNLREEHKKYSLSLRRSVI